MPLHKRSRGSRRERLHARVATAAFVMVAAFVVNSGSEGESANANGMRRLAEASNTSLCKATHPEAAACSLTCNMEPVPCDVENACLEQIDCKPWGKMVEAVIFFFSFAGLAIVCDDHLVGSLETLCVRWNIREDIAGASFMAFGSAAPEIIVNAVSTIKAVSGGANGGGDPEAASLGVGAIIGSGIIAFSLIPGCCGLFAGTTLYLKRRPLIRDVGTYTAALILLRVFFSDGVIVAYEGCVLFALYFCYIIMLVLSPQVRKGYKDREAVSAPSLYERFLDEEEGELTPRNMNRTKSFVLDAKEKEEEEEKLEYIRLAGEFSEPEQKKLRQTALLFQSAGSDEVPAAQLGNIFQLLGPDFGFERTVSNEDVPGLIEGTALEDVDMIPYDDYLAFVAMIKHQEEPGVLGMLLEMLLTPLELMFKYTCPPCEFGTKWESLYPVTFLISFTWVSFFSTIISAVVTRWVVMSHASMVTFGLAIVAVGAEIPDCIQSVTVARKGYGSMAVSNGLGSQICNILVGLGMPWTLSTVLAGKNIIISKNNLPILQLATEFQFANVGVNFILLLGAALFYKQEKALLTKLKGQVFMVTYVVVLGGFLVTAGWCQDGDTWRCWQG